MDNQEYHPEGDVLLPPRRDVAPCSGHGFEKSNKYFNSKFRTGFAWEVKKVFSGPPKVVFSWRHWAHMGTKSLSEEMQGKGKLIELEGFTRANFSDDGKLRDIEVFFDQEKFLADMKRAEE